MRASIYCWGGGGWKLPPQTLDNYRGGIVLLLNSVYSGLQNSCHKCGLRRKNGCVQHRNFRAKLASLPNQNL